MPTDRLVAALQQLLAARRKRDGGPEVRPPILRRLRNKRSDAGDLGRETFAPEVADCSVGGLHIAIADGDACGGGQAFDVSFIARLGAYKSKAIHRPDRAKLPREGQDLASKQSVPNATIHPRKFVDGVFCHVADKA
jgi:hypothetical protein